MSLFLDLPRLSFPAQPIEIFQREAPLVMEIGFGDGGFLEWMAKTHPHWNCLGADIAYGSVTRTFRRMRRAGLTNVRLHHGSGLFLLRNLLGDASVSRVYVNFPDPWRKSRHAQRRLFQPCFFELLAARLKTDGALLFTTDDASYFDQTITLARESGYYKLSRTSAPPATLQTKYATKWREAGRKVYHVHLQKQFASKSKIPPIIHKEKDMHHALLSGSIPAIMDFEKIVHPFPNGHIVILDVLQMIGQEGLVFMARSHEPELIQDLFVQLRPTETDSADLLLSIMNFGKPIATRGTRETVNALCHWLTQQGLTICNTYY